MKRLPYSYQTIADNRAFQETMSLYEEALLRHTEAEEVTHKAHYEASDAALHATYEALVAVIDAHVTVWKEQTLCPAAS